ncbi:penicillin acylase family protein [Polaromonas eurypsychrophila]|uniref:Penicillin acylase family protein n=1 Tax=Polaromonas eurypsychrophila TaxID=1614635 RepID=A0A916WN89_9BURK|nr:penicillin acylase family protein [Polaromonas eurypsychrophila]GGB13668.1 penicillin acylase family protein [Polaromonas eurypsychrophila]
MVWIKRLLGGVLLLVLLLAAAIGIYIYRSFPALDGELKVGGLSAAVNVARDGADVTHIKAQSPRDAWMALGYVHAQERGWQLEFNRRVMHGELSEVLGEATLDTDKLMRTLGIMAAAQRQWQVLPAEAKQALQAYSDGINAFYAGSAQALSPEFHILGVKPCGSGRPWTPQDSVGWALMMALDLGGNWGNEFARLSAAKVLSTEQLWQLFTPYPGEAPASKTDFARLYAELGVFRPDAIKTGASGARFERAGGLSDAEEPATSANLLALDINDWAANIGNVEGKGSNSWVLAGTHTASGKPLLANDPHLGLSAPAIWYFARLQAPAGPGADGKVTPALDVIGATLPGLPFVVLGRTAKVAWGFTNTGPDVQDLYLEQINPTNPQQYRVPGAGPAQWAKFKTRVEVIKVKGKSDVSLNVRSSRHGPVLSDAQKTHTDLLDTSKYVISLRWSALETDNLTAVAALRANQAQSVDELIAAYADHHSPMQNVVMADVAGKVAYKAIGKVPLRKADNDILGVAPSPGWLARYDWAGWLPYAQTPQADAATIGKKGWFSNANQSVVPPGSDLFLGQDWVVPYRFDRIEKLLAAAPKHDAASMQKIQSDQLSSATLRLLPFLQKTVSQHPLAAEVQALLTGFDGVMRADSAAPLVFSVWIDELSRGVIGSKLGEARLKSMYGKRHFRSAIEDMLERDDKSWCGTAGCAAQSTAALDRALTLLQATRGGSPAKWTWGEAHQALSAHRPFSNVPALAKLFDVNVPTGGDTFTVNVGQYWPNDSKFPFANRHAASLRAVYDLADLEKSQFVYQTGQSGLVFSSRYRDMSRRWADVSYRPLQMSPASFSHELQLKP